MNQILFPDIKSSQTEQERQWLDNCSSYQESKKYIEKINNRDFLEGLALSLDSTNCIAAYVITGGAFGYFYREAIVQVTSNLLHVYRWTDVTPDVISSGVIRGRIDWRKVLAVIKQDGYIPEENLKSIDKNSKVFLGRDVTAFAVSKDNRAWVRINAGDHRLNVHRLYHLMLELMDKSNYANANSPMM